MKSGRLRLRRDRWWLAMLKTKKEYKRSQNVHRQGEGKKP